MALRRSTRVVKTVLQDPYNIGLDNYDLGQLNKTQMMTVYRQVRTLHGLPALPPNYTRNQIISIFLLHSELKKVFYVKGVCHHANNGAHYITMEEELSSDEDTSDNERFIDDKTDYDSEDEDYISSCETSESKEDDI